jgi:Holliday junction DNA helicase RuvA
MLATCEPSEFALAVISEDIKTLTGIPGIGPKSAKRIILELKDKIKTQQEIETIKNQINGNIEPNSKMQKAIENNEKQEEAIAALQVLGYNKKEIEKVFSKLEKNELSTEELIKKGLNLLGK